MSKFEDDIARGCLESGEPLDALYGVGWWTEKPEPEPDHVTVQKFITWSFDEATKLFLEIQEDKAKMVALQSRIAELEAKLKITDELLKEATEAIGAVVACCTYNSNDDAKIGIYGIDQKAFTRIDQFITHYNDAVSAGKVSVDVKTSTDNNKRE